MDFLLLVNSEYPGRYVTIEDACARTHRRLRVAIRDGEIAEVEPETLYLLRGGT